MKKRNLYFLTAILSVAGYAWLSWNIVEGTASDDVPTPCIVKHATGIPCPSCGTTRAVVELTRGNVVQSLLINPFGILAAAALFLLPLWIFTDRIKNNDSFFRFYRWIEKVFSERRWVSVPAVLLVIANWIWNISKGL